MEREREGEKEKVTEREKEKVMERETEKVKEREKEGESDGMIERRRKCGKRERRRK